MSLDAIVNHILGEADKQKDALIQQAKQQANAVIQEAQKEAERFYQEIIAREKLFSERQKQKLMVDARLEGKKNLLNAKQEMFKKVFEQLKSGLKKDQFKKEQILPHQVREAGENTDFYLAGMRLDYEPQIAKILFS